jgi:haloalkane dehalogenase
VALGEQAWSAGFGVLGGGREGDLEAESLELAEVSADLAVAIGLALVLPTTKENAVNHIQAVRTPDDRFAGLADFPYRPRYVDDLPGYTGLRAHFIDEAPQDADRTFFCLHGEPTWSYLYRKMIPLMLESGARVVAPDLPGFGRSDKPAQASTYTFSFHRQFLLRLAERLALTHVTLVAQDWGGTLGLTLPVDPGFRPALERLFLMNTVLPAGEPLGPHYYEWRSLVQNTADLPVGEWMRQAAPGLTDHEKAAYDAPFPDTSFQAGARAFPDLAMDKPQMDGVAQARAALNFWAHDWQGQSFMAIGAKDPDADPMHTLRNQIRGCPDPLTIADAGHFVPEWGESVARAALRSFGDI